MAELIGVDGKTTRAPATAKHRHPENPALTWSGRGRKPQQFVDGLAAGKTAEDLAIGWETGESASSPDRTFVDGAANGSSEPSLPNTAPQDFASAEN